MRILFSSNVIIPCVAEAAGVQQANSAGWIEAIVSSFEEYDDVKLGIICPGSIEKKGKSNFGNWWIIPKSGETNCYRRILSEFAPDILHIFGSESERILELITMYGKPNRTIIHLQGIAEKYGVVYLNDIPKRYSRGRIVETLLGHGLKKQRDSLLQRGKTERKALKMVCHVTGRTDFDRMAAESVSQSIQYHFCWETLRSHFYQSEKWDINRSVPCTILARNTDSPIKGFHKMLEALPSIISRYPSTVLNVVGSSIRYPKTIKQHLVEHSYAALCRSIIEKNGLKDHIRFMGNLNEEEMIQAYLASNVVVSSSIIENSPNIICEAKMLGVPVVSSFVGGCGNLIMHGYDGYLYDYQSTDMLAYYVCKIFGNKELAQTMSHNAIESQKKISDKQENKRRLLGIYKEILSQ